jgi:competence protein ComEC
MMFLLLGGKLANRRPDSLNSLGFAAMLLAGCSPLSAGQLGLQMSFGATLGILLLQGKCSAPGRNYLERKKAMPSLARTGLLFANDGLGLTASATALVLPVQLLRLSSGFSLLAFPANLFFVPLSGIFFQLGAVSAVLKPLAPLVELLGTLMLRGVSRLNRAPAPVLRGGPAATISLGLCAAVAGLVLLLYYIGKAPKLRFAAALIGIILLCGCWAPGFSQRNRTVAQVLETEGTAVLVHKNGQAALLGCGGGAMAAATAKRALDTLGILQLQTLLIPGASEKLAAGAPELLRDVSITQVIRYEDCGIFTPFVLWDTDAGIFYCAENNAACLLRLGEERFVLRFSGEPPAQWRAFPRLEGGLA